RQPASSRDGPVTPRNASSTALSCPSRACRRTKTYWSTGPSICLLHYFLPLTVHYCSFWRRVEQRARSGEPRTGLKTGHYRERRMPTRYDAWKLLCEYTASESLRKHMLAVEACVRAYARKSGADEELWSLTALLHDFDYEQWPNDAHSPTEEHPAGGSAILRDRGYPEEMIHAIVSHAEYCNVPRETPLEHTLFACDELAGFLTACSLVKPRKSIFEVEPDSVKRKLKDKAFARGVNREDVRKGAEELGIPIDEHIAFCIAAMREAADALGLRGNEAASA